MRTLTGCSLDHRRLVVVNFGVVDLTGFGFEVVLANICDNLNRWLKVAPSISK